MPRQFRVVLCLALVLGAGSLQAAKDRFFPDDQIPHFNVPKMAQPPTIDGTIDEAEWRTAVRIMGMSTAHNNRYRGRPHVFWVSWDEQHIYIAGRAHVLKGHVLGKSRREKFTTGTVFDDAFEFGLSMEGRNQPAGEAESFFKFILNVLKSGEYLKMYPSIGQYLYNWRPELDMETRFYEGEQANWFEIEVALDLEDLQMPVENKAGDLIKILLAHDGKNPGWQWTCVPTASGYLVHTGYPRGHLGDTAPYVQVEQLEGFDDEKLLLKSVIRNPGPQPVKVRVQLQIRNEKERGDQPIEPTIAVNLDRELEIPAGGEVRFDQNDQWDGFIYGNHPKLKRHRMKGAFDWRITMVDQPEAPPVYRYYLVFQKDTEKAHLKYSNTPASFNMGVRYNPVSHKLWVEADTLDAQLPDETKAAAATYAVTQGERTVADGRIEQFVFWKYQDLIQLPKLAPGNYEVKVALVDAAGRELVSRAAKIEKKDEAAEYPEWWGKKFGNPEQLLKPFTPLEVDRALFGGKTTLNCFGRSCEIDSLGLPVRLESNGGPVLTAPARMVLVVDGREQVVETSGKVEITEEKDWRVSFTGAGAVASGVRFRASGMMEQDGLVSLELTYEPVAGPVSIQELRVEFPVDDSWHNHMACMGVGGNYSARFIGAVPPGQGEVWSSLRDIGRAGSGRTVGSFFQNLWVGTEKRGFFWYGTSDEGWVPDDKIAALTIAREGTSTVVRNHLIGTWPGQKPYELRAPRTVRFSYNASPFKKLTKGWRVNLRSAANGFTQKPKYKWNWDTGTEYFSVLSPPFPKRDRWDEYYAHCQEQAEKLARTGIYSPAPRMRPYLTNQIALRGYMRKSLEGDIYNYFKADWETSDVGESLNESYRDYMMWLQHRQVGEGGCRHFYYDISMCGKISRELVAGFGYILPDGRIQPSGGEWTLRKWYLRAYALMQDHGLYPTGISGHATQTLPLVAMPFSDAILDSEFPMKDPISVYPSDRMIALSHPQNFGCNINHLGFMNPNWAGMHDAGMGGGHGSIFDRPGWRHWGIEREDVEFIPYWRNDHVVQRLGDGLICSMWRRPNSVILGILNYGPDDPGFEKTRPAELVLDLDALGIPRDDRRVRVQVMNQNALYAGYGKYVDHLPWYQDLPGTPETHDKSRIRKYRPQISPKLDLQTGMLYGFDVFYHDQYFLAVHWDDAPVSQATWPQSLKEQQDAVLNWGMGQAHRVFGPSVRTDTPGCQVMTWRRPGSVLVLVHNTGDNEKGQIVEVDLDLEALGVKVRPEQLWSEFVQAYALDGKELREVIWNEDFQQNRRHYYTRGALVFDGHIGKLVGLMQPGETRLLSIDKY